MNNSDYIFCPHCGTKLPSSSKFCNKCGTPMPVINVAEERNSGNASNSNDLTPENNAKKKSKIKDKTETAWGYILIIFAVILFVSCPKIFKSESYDSDGYEYVCSNLKSPSSAKLISYIDKQKFRNFLKEEANISYSKDIDWEVYDIEAMNGFGGVTREKYVVLFYKGTPKCIDEMILLIASKKDIDVKNDSFIDDYIRMNKDVYGINIEFEN